MERPYRKNLIYIDASLPPGRRSDSVLPPIGGRIRQKTDRLRQMEEDQNAGSGRRSEAEQNLTACRAELHSAEQTVTAAKNAVSGHAMLLSTRSETRTGLEVRQRKLHTELDGVRAKLRVFRAMERDYENYQKSVRTVMQEAQKGGLLHIHGPVSRLIRTGDAFTAAIEIALGSAMQQIVVDTEADGKAAIAFLKRCG